MRRVKFILAGLIFQLVLSNCGRQQNEVQKQLTGTDQIIISESLKVLRLLTKFDTIYINPMMGSSVSDKFHDSAVEETHQLSKEMKLSIKNTMKTSVKKEITQSALKSDSAFVNLAENNIKALNFSKIAYGSIDSLNYASTLLYWFQVKDDWVGIYLYFEERDKKYTLIGFGRTDLIETGYTPESLSQENFRN